jgi:hypothetical protein
MYVWLWDLFSERSHIGYGLKRLRCLCLLPDMAAATTVPLQAAAALCSRQLGRIYAMKAAGLSGCILLLLMLQSKGFCSHPASWLYGVLQVMKGGIHACVPRRLWQLVLPQQQHLHLLPSSLET